MKITTISLATLLGFLCALDVRAITEVHVSPNGNDANPGTAQAPLATLEQARQVIRGLKKSHALDAGGANVVLHSGQYLLREPFTLTFEDSGSKGSPIHYIAATGETPVITSAVPIIGWKRLVDEPATVSTTAKGKLWYADVPKGWHFHFLYINGKRQKVASSMKTDNWHSWPVPVKVGAVEAAGQKLTFPAGLLDGLPDNGDVEINLMPVNWWNTLSVLRDIDPANNTARRHSKNPTTFWPDRFPDRGNYNLTNALKFLSEPGEWCVDSAAGRVYLWPAGDSSPSSDQIWAPSLYRLLQIQGGADDKSLVHDIIIRGLTFAFTDRLPEDQWPDDWVKRQSDLPDAQLFIDGATDCTIDRNIFTYSGSYCVALQNYAQRIQITANDMANAGCGGILMQGYGPGTTDVNRDNVVRRNYIHDIGYGGYLHSSAIALYQSGENDISLNLIKDVPYIGISIVGAGWDMSHGGSAGMDSYGNSEAMYKIRWNDFPQGQATVFTREGAKPYLHSRNNTIRHNIVIDYMSTMDDGGALYSWGCGLNNVWDGNLLRLFKNGFIFPLYMDDLVDGAVVSNNISWSPALRTHNRGANTWTNNVLSASKPDGYDGLLLNILNEARSEGGIPGNLDSAISTSKP